MPSNINIICNVLEYDKKLLSPTYIAKDNFLKNIMLSGTIIDPLSAVPCTWKLLLHHQPTLIDHLCIFHLLWMQVNDLKNLLDLYREWHKQLIPYYNFDQFVQKVEQVGSTKRVKVKNFSL